MTADLLALLAVAHPNAAQGDLLAMLNAVPDRRPPGAAQQARDGHSSRRGIYPPRKPQRPPMRVVAIERRRRLAYSGPLPPQIASTFTLGELAVLRIVGDEVRERGFCALTLGAIAARAGCCRELARRTMRKAHNEMLLTIEERRRPGQVNLANVVRIISREWLAWIARGPKPKKIGPTENGRMGTKISEKGFRVEEATQAPGSTQAKGQTQAVPWPDTAQGRRSQAEPGVAGLSPPEGKLPGMQQRGMHGNAGVRHS